MEKGKNLHDEVVRVAYDLYEKRGKVHGYDLVDWLEAERIVLERHAGEVEREANTIGSAKVRKPSARTRGGALKTAKKSSEGSAAAKTKKGSPRKKT
ncbi:MAG TPA: DUF2934 domain-containing protein [Bacteroidota bacterium]|nr:DUF2934 domain-containing protein [Bacteroidota bacterium]